jgi:hypothetical protein
MQELTLEQAGFTQEQIQCLRDVREMYPYIEYIDSQREWHRLRFVKWLYLKGHIEK